MNEPANILAREDSNHVSGTVDTTTADRPAVTSDEVTVKALNLFKKGESRVFRTNLVNIPHAPPIPDMYTALDITYELESDAIFSDAVIKIATGLTEHEFRIARILRLSEDDIYPNGFFWVDCTVRPQPKKDARIGDEYLPDLAAKTLACYFEGKSATPTHYFALVLEKGRARSEAASVIRMSLEKAEPDESANAMRYFLAVTNAGPQDAAEVNFSSTFSPGVELTEVRPSNGKCQPSRYGSSESSVVCHLGALKTGEQTIVEFVAKAGREGPKIDRNSNRSWWIKGFSRTGVAAEVDRFSVRPLAK